MNSFSAQSRRPVTHEIGPSDQGDPRPAADLSGKPRLWDESKRTPQAMRSKGAGSDYRYVPRSRIWTDLR